MLIYELLLGESSMSFNSLYSCSPYRINVRNSNAIHYNTIQYNTIQYKTIRHYKHEELQNLFLCAKHLHQYQIHSTRFKFRQKHYKSHLGLYIPLLAILDLHVNGELMCTNELLC